MSDGREFGGTQGDFYIYIPSHSLSKIQTAVLASNISGWQAMDQYKLKKVVNKRGQMDRKLHLPDNQKPCRGLHFTSSTSNVSTSPATDRRICWLTSIGSSHRKLIGRPECKHTSNGGTTRWQYTQIRTCVYTEQTHIKIRLKIAQYVEIQKQRDCRIRQWWLISYHFAKSALRWLNYAACSHFCQCRWQNGVSPEPRKSHPLTTRGSDCRDSPHESPGSETQGKALPSANWLHHLAVMCRRPLPLRSSSNGTSEDGDQSDETDVDIRCRIRLQPDSHELPLTAGTPRKKGSRGKKELSYHSPLPLLLPLKSIHRWQKSPEWPYQLFYYFSRGGWWRRWWQEHILSSEIRWESLPPTPREFLSSVIMQNLGRCVWLRRTWARGPLIAPLGLPSLQGHSFNTHPSLLFSFRACWHCNILSGLSQDVHWKDRTPDRQVHQTHLLSYKKPMMPVCCYWCYMFKQ